MDSDTTVVIEAAATKRVTAKLDRTPPVYKRWWFWTAIGGVVAVTAAVSISAAVLIERPSEAGDIEPGQIATQSVRF